MSGPSRQERADAAQNRVRILTAADELFARHGAQSVTMDDIARAAGVGRATLYRRYPDRASIAVALLDDHERALQEALLRGAPPLGPGVEPRERLVAFYAAMVELLEQHAHLLLGTEIGSTRYATGAYGFWRAHVLSLLRAAGVPHSAALADALLAPLAPDLYRYQRQDLGLSTSDIHQALTELARRVLC